MRVVSWQQHPTEAGDWLKIARCGRTAGLIERRHAHGSNLDVLEVETATDQILSSLARLGAAGTVFRDRANDNVCVADWLGSVEKSWHPLRLSRTSTPALNQAMECW